MKIERRGWHKDGKWICAIAAGIFLSLALTLFGLYRLTEQETAVHIMSVAIASAFSPRGLDDEKDLAVARQKLAQQGSLSPFPGLPITVTHEEVKDLSPREARFLIFRKFAEPLYAEGTKGLAKFAPSPEAAAQFSREAQLIAVLSRANHDRLLLPLGISLGAALIFLAGAIFFSSGIGRFITPAIVLMIVSIVPVGVLGFVRFLALHPPQGSSLAPGSGSAVGQVVQSVAPAATTALLTGYIISLSAAVILLVIGGGVKIGQRWRRT